MYKKQSEPKWPGLQIAENRKCYICGRRLFDRSGHKNDIQLYTFKQISRGWKDKELMTAVDICSDCITEFRKFCKNSQNRV